MRSKGVLWFLITNIKIGIALGIIGFSLYFILNASKKKSDQQPIYYAYDYYHGKAQFCYFSKNKRNADLVLNCYYSTSSQFRSNLRVGKDFGALPINSPLKLIDTIKGNIVKFRGTYETYHNSNNSFIGYTYIMNIHSVKVPE
jgi:hypothetical protein